MRAANDVTKAAQIGNHVVIGNWSGINREQSQLFDCECEIFTGVEKRRNERDLNWKLWRMEAGHHAFLLIRAFLLICAFFFLLHFFLNILLI